MDEEQVTTPLSPSHRPPIEPLPYQQELLKHLKGEEAELWNWFSTHQLDQRSDSVRLELLKSTYRIERDSKPDLYELTDKVARQLGLDVPTTLYQAQNPEGLNVSTAYIPGEAHIIFHGAIQEALTPSEIEAVLGHELTHFYIFDGWNGELFVAEQILNAMVNDQSAQTTHLATLRLFALYGEILADRGAFHVTRDPVTTISGILKLETGEKDISAESYLRQAEEIFSKEDSTSAGVTHPETFIRTRALQLWSDSPETANSEVKALIEGPPALATLDLLGRKRTTALTRRLVEHLLSPRWFQTEPVLAHARTFFNDFEPIANDVEPVTNDVQDEQLARDLETSDDELRGYYCYVILDFVAVDRDLDETALAAALHLTETLELGDRFRKIAMKELKLKKRTIDKVDKDKENLLEKARKETTD